MKSFSPGRIRPPSRAGAAGRCSRSKNSIGARLGDVDVSHQLAQTIERPSEASYASLKHARSLASEAIKPEALAPPTAQLELGDLSQDLVDE